MVALDWALVCPLMVFLHFQVGPIAIYPLELVVNVVLNDACRPVDLYNFI